MTRSAPFPTLDGNLLVVPALYLRFGSVRGLLALASETRYDAAEQAPFTMALAVLAFGDHLGRRESAGAAAIVVGAILLSFAPGPLRANVAGVAAIAGACVAWALDNNLAQRLALKDPVSVARAKTLAAGVIGVALALASGDHLPGPGVLAGAVAVGAVGYGASIVLHLVATRGIGAARQAALFATGPFIGAVASVPLRGSDHHGQDGDGVHAFLVISETPR